ncbi:MAG: ribonuclease P protein component [Actinomycetota bacterium]
MRDGRSWPDGARRAALGSRDSLLSVRSRQVRTVLDGGKPLHGRRMVMFVAPGSGDTAVVAARRIGGAVQRNRARRILRAAWQQAAPQTDDTDVVLVAREAIVAATMQDLVAEMIELLQHAGFTRP